MRTRFFSFLFLMALLAPLHPTFATGCCVDLKKTAEKCTDPSCANVCFSEPNATTCTSRMNEGFNRQWNSADCAVVPECTGLIATGSEPGACICATQQFSDLNLADCKSKGSDCRWEPTTASTNVSSDGAGISGTENMTPPTTGEGAASTPVVFGNSVTTRTVATNIATFIPKLSVPIPHLSFSSVAVQGPEGKRFMDIPFLAQWIGGLMNYILGIITIIVVVMITIGGILYLTAGANTSRVTKAKTIMADAVVGMLLAMGTFLILRTINPTLVHLTPLRVRVAEREIASLGYMQNAAEAAGILAEVGISGTGAFQPATMNIPLACPGRNSAYDDGDFVINGKKIYPRKFLAIDGKGGALDNNTIEQYLQEQARTGIPAAVLMAQVYNESGNKCAVRNLFNNPASCGGLAAAHYNFGGIGCTQRQVPQNICAHIALGPLSKPAVPCEVQNKSIGDICVQQCETLTKAYGSVKDVDAVYTQCGPLCYAQPSHNYQMYDGKNVYLDTIQCSRSFKNATEFLNDHAGWVKYCLPFNQSVYDFAYCIGASSYATDPLKGVVLAEFIDRNCLCDPEKDASRCVRNKDLEAKLAANQVKRTQLFKYKEKDGQIDFQAIIDQLYQTTNGELIPRSVIPPTEEEELPIPFEVEPF